MTDANKCKWYPTHARVTKGVLRCPSHYSIHHAKVYNQTQKRNHKQLSRKGSFVKERQEGANILGVGPACCRVRTPQPVGGIIKTRGIIKGKTWQESISPNLVAGKRWSKVRNANQHHAGLSISSRTGRKRSDVTKIVKLFRGMHRIKEWLTGPK
jgi:hypothetical protein